MPTLGPTIEKAPEVAFQVTHAKRSAKSVVLAVHAAVMEAPTVPSACIVARVGKVGVVAAGVPASAGAPASAVVVPPSGPGGWRSCSVRSRVSEGRAYSGDSPSSSSSSAPGRTSRV